MTVSENSLVYDCQFSSVFFDHDSRSGTEDARIWKVEKTDKTERIIKGYQIKKRKTIEKFWKTIFLNVLYELNEGFQGYKNDVSDFLCIYNKISYPLILAGLGCRLVYPFSKESPYNKQTYVRSSKLFRFNSTLLCSYFSNNKSTYRFQGDVWKKLKINLKLPRAKTSFYETKSE